MTADGTNLTVEYKVHFRQALRGRKQMSVGDEPPPPPAPPVVGRVPRIARLMALAIHVEDLVRRREIRDYADVARLGHVTRARVAQIVNLLNLAPDLQEALLFLPETTTGRDAVREWQLRPIAGEVDWGRQRRMWRKLRTSAAEC